MEVSDEVRFRVSPDSTANVRVREPKREKRLTVKAPSRAANNSSKRTEEKIHSNSIRFQAVINASGLIELDLSNRKLKAIPSEVFTLGRLEVLHIHHNELHSIPRKISSLHRLKIIDASHNSIVVIPDTLSNLKHLKELDLSNNQIHVLPPEISNLKRLAKLNVGYNQLESLPHTFGMIASLQQLELPGNNLWHLPPSFRRLKKVRYLNLGKNQLDQLPIYVCSLSNLEGLDLHGNLLINLPQEMVKLRKLKELNLGNNKTTFPNVITKLKSLRSLDISKNLIVYITPEISNLSKLKMLNLQGNQLQELPQISTITYLNLSENLIHNLSLSKSKALKYLNLTSNQLQNMPLGIYNQKNLEVMKLRNNRISYVSQDIVLLQKLKYLDLGNNDLQSLPHVIYDLENLQTFNVKGNSIETKQHHRELKNPRDSNPNIMENNTAPNSHARGYSQTNGYNTNNSHLNNSITFLPEQQNPTLHTRPSLTMSRGDFLETNPRLRFQKPPASSARSGLSYKQQIAQASVPNHKVVHQHARSAPQETRSHHHNPSSLQLWPYHEAFVMREESHLNLPNKMRRTHSQKRQSSIISNYSNAATVDDTEIVGDDISLGEQDYQYQPTNVQDQRLIGVVDEIENMLKHQLLNSKK